MARETNEKRSNHAMSTPHLLACPLCDAVNEFLFLYFVHACDPDILCKFSLLNGWKLPWPTYRRWQHLTRSSTDRIIRIAPCCTLPFQFRVRTTVAVTCRWVTSPSVCKSAPHPAPSHTHTPKIFRLRNTIRTPTHLFNPLSLAGNNEICRLATKKWKMFSAERQIAANKSLRRLIEGDARRQHISSVAAWVS